MFPVFFVTSASGGSLRQASTGDARLPSVEDLEGFARQMLGSDFLVCFSLVARKTIKERGGGGREHFFSKTDFGGDFPM